MAGSTPVGDSLATPPGGRSSDPTRAPTAREVGRRALVPGRIPHGRSPGQPQCAAPAADLQELTVPTSSSTPTTTHAVVPAARGQRPATGRAWAWTGVAAGALGLATVQTSMAASVDWQATQGDAAAMLADASGKQGTYLLFHTVTALCAVAVPVFAAGLHRRLDQQAPAGSLLGRVAGWGLLLVAVALLLGSGLDTQYMLALGEPDVLVPESAAFYTDWVATVPWLWLGAGLSGVALAVASLRHSAAPRWIGVVSLLLGGITLVAGVSPFQYLAGFTGPVWLLVVALGFALGDRR